MKLKKNSEELQAINENTLNEMEEKNKIIQSYENELHKLK